MTRPAAGGGQATLARRGFNDAARARRLLTELGLWSLDGAAADPAAEAIIAVMAASADPDLAVLALTRLVEGQTDSAVLQAMRTSPGLRERMCAVLGGSEALGDFLVAHPGEWRHLVDDSMAYRRPSAQGLIRGLLDAVGAPTDADPATAIAGDGTDRVRTLRNAYRRAILDLAARDLTGDAAVDEAAGELSDLAAATLGAALAIARAEQGAASATCRLAVIGMGKGGGRELNYVSDVDVIFVAEPIEENTRDSALRAATALAARMMSICGEVAWPVDAALRPEGKDGPLVRTLDSHEAYYKRWAKGWEFQALLKARPLAGDVALGQSYVDRISPMVWAAAERENFVDDVRAMRRRVEQTLPAASRSRELKLGPGGLRDIEFAVQLLQLVHGRGDELLRSPTTLSALSALADGGYVGRSDAAELADSYRWLRTAEHRLQLFHLRRTHSLPVEPAELHRLAASMGYRSSGRADLVSAFLTDHARHGYEVRRLHEKLFYRPLLESVARVPSQQLRLDPGQARARLAALGFADPAGAMRHLSVLTEGVTRRASIQRALLPAMLVSFAGSADPDAGLLGYRKVSDALGRTPWFLRFLRDEGKVAERLALLLGSGRYVSDLLERAPEALRMLADDRELAPVPAGSIRSAMVSTSERTADGTSGRPDRDAAALAVRGLRRRELLRTASATLLGLTSIEEVGLALSDVADATIASALHSALAIDRAADRAADPHPSDGPGRAELRFAVIAMGRLGGRELNFGSDADVLYVCSASDPAQEPAVLRRAITVAEELGRLLSAPTPDPPLLLDSDLRPEGRSGPLVRTIDAYGAYYRRWGALWERQALLRARFVAGDEELGAQFIAMADQHRYSDAGLTMRDRTEIRRIKARVERERLPRGADPATHVKLGRGGLSDVEWAVQQIQLAHAAQVPALRTTRTLPALTVAVDAGLVDDTDAAALSSAWQLASQVRNATMLVRGRPSDQVPRAGRELIGVARAAGYPADRDPGEFVEDYLRTTRRARLAFERVFYG